MEQTSGAEEAQKIKNGRGFIVDRLIQGFLILLPLTIILLLISVVFNFIFSIVSPLSYMLQPGVDEPHWFINLLAVAILLVFIFIIGMVIKNKMSRAYFISFEKKYLTKIPLYSLIHQTIYQFAGLKKLPFSEVVLVDIYKTGVLMTGFVAEKSEQDIYTVFVPTAPNPTNGNIYHVPKEMVTFLPITTQDAMRTIVGMGTGSAQLVDNYHQQQLNKASLI